MSFFTVVPSLLLLISYSWAAPAGLSQSTITTAGGDVPKGGSPPRLSANGITNFQLANFIENIESQFFAQALTSLAADTAFTTPGSDGVSVQDVITKVTAQELVHKATIEGALTAAGAVLVSECTKVDTVASTSELLIRANVSRHRLGLYSVTLLTLFQIITSTSIGAIIALSGSLAKTDPNLITTSASILGVEARQDGFFRNNLGSVPDPTPFETQISAAWAYNLILGFVDPKSCPTLLPFPVLPVLTITSPPPLSPPPKTPPTTISFTVDRSVVLKTSKFFIGWVNQANAPVYTAAIVSITGKGTAPTPPGINGATFVALTNQNTATTVDSLTSATIAGPAVVVVS